MIIFYLIAFFFLAFVLTKAADLTLEAIKSISRAIGTQTFVLAALVLSLATSLPELFVGITAALEGASSLSFGNLLGANVTNLLLVAGLTTVIIGGVAVKGEEVFHEFFLAAVAGILPLLLLLDGRLSRIDGLILLVLYLAYTLSFFKSRFLEMGRQRLTGNFLVRFIKSAEEVEKKTERSLGHLLVGVAALLFISDLIVQTATKIAGSLSLPIFVIGLIFLSLGTTLPEVVVSFRALKTRSDGVFFGNLLGSLIINSTLIVGLVSLISPIEVAEPIRFLVPGLIFILALVFFWIFIKTKHFLSRREAAVLLALYLAFVILGFV